MQLHNLMQHAALAPARISVQLKHGDDFPGSQDMSQDSVAVEDEQPWLAEPNMKNITSMADYLSLKRIDAAISLELANLTYTSFKNELYNLRPELASKNFSVGVDSSGNVRILDPQESLSAEERIWLTEQLEHRGIKDHLVDHSSAMSALAKYDKTGFNARYKLEAADIARIVDYGKILESDDMEQTWKNQISERAEKRTPYISVRI
ncbi:hypothetical protein JN403_10455 [Pseudomonas sp. 15A4]|uniref:hypothetical protein n=1 Tax=Pseudomonas sp. 15A4 TaxID=2804761 RepID=UPI001967CE90|nr:hypothetical protein [Pseudomonas sp. 15A4]QSB21218.1 hypothetical protein JN403_10455 [Pseudomonas sp. 15A4]